MGNKIILRGIFSFSITLVCFLILMTFLGDNLYLLLFLNILILISTIFFLKLKKTIKILTIMVVISSLVSIPLLLFIDSDVLKDFDLLNSILSVFGFKKFNEGMGISYFLKVLFRLIMPLFLILYTLIFLILIRIKKKKNVL